MWYRWYSEKFLKGVWDKEECVSEWNKYRDCLSVSIFLFFFYILEKIFFFFWLKMFVWNKYIFFLRIKECPDVWNLILILTCTWKCICNVKKTQSLQDYTDLPFCLVCLMKFLVEGFFGQNFIVNESLFVTWCLVF